MSTGTAAAVAITAKPVAITRIQASFAVSGRLDEGDFAALAAQGFRSIISNRPDGEEPGQLTAREEAVLAWRAGLQFRHVPATICTRVTFWIWPRNCPAEQRPRRST